MMIKTSNLGYPRIGINRELKFALEKFWQSKNTLESVNQTARQIQLHNWKIHQDAGIDFIPSNDFSFYDHVLDTTVMVGAIPDRFHLDELDDPSVRYYAMARGFQKKDGGVIHALEMTKWFNTNYHYLVPEVSPQTEFNLNSDKPVNTYEFAKDHGYLTRPVILGPVSFLLMSKSPGADFDPLDKLMKLLPLYKALFTELMNAGAEWIQLDEPFLVCDLPKKAEKAYRTCFEFFKAGSDRPNVILTTYFEDLIPNMDIVQDMPFEGLHIDLTNHADWRNLTAGLPSLHTLSLGVISGRNIWRADLTKISRQIEQLLPALNADQLLISPSCSLLHIPQDVDLEDSLDEQKKSWLAFARQKLEEISALKEQLLSASQTSTYVLKNQKIITDRTQFLSSQANKSSKGILINDEEQNKWQRKSDFAVRKEIQKQRLNLPVLPTTTIGSFPQTAEVRKARADFNRDEMSWAEYKIFLKKEIKKTIQLQEELGLDVLVHGEFERNDMVQYFAEKLDGFMFTNHGWVQSFGSRYVRPPIIYGTLNRPEPMTIPWAEYAQSLTKKPVKGMLTGPVTILQWSYARDDQPRSQTCMEIAHAIREEVLDLEKIGIAIIQIDEPALREGLPLRRSEWDDYLDWAVTCFRVASCGVKDETQIHTHMCYAEFNDIMPAIAEMDADVISIEASRSGMELLGAFKKFDYPNEIGPGIYDIHSPNIPSVEDMTVLLLKALEVISPDKLWANPDCGLKTRKWEEVLPSLKTMVKASSQVREKINR